MATQSPQSTISTFVPTDMPALRRALYDKCSTEELEQFHRARTHEAPASITRVWLLSGLLGLDKEMTFRLMDLPTELRLLIIEIALGCNSTNPQNKIHAQILCVCKKVNEESQKILDKRVENEIHLMRFNVDRCSKDCRPNLCDPKCSPEVQYRSGKQDPVMLGSVKSLLVEMAALPPIAMQATRMVIDINFTNTCRYWQSPLAFSCGVTNRQLYLLLILAQKTNIKHISVRVNYDHTNIVLNSTIWPLSLCGPDIDLTVQGLEPKNIAYLQRAQLRGRFPRPGLSKWSRMILQATELKQRIDEAGIKNTGVQYLARALGAPLDKMSWRSIDYLVDFKIGRKLAEAQAFLDKDKWQTLSREADQILKDKGRV